jgi:EAL and modified HD-GYP domain-containing signal transduction protein
VTADRRLVDAVEAAFSRSARRDWARFDPRESPSIGRQEIFTHAGDVHGYELFYRLGGAERSRVDRWPASQQDIATARVLGAARTGLGAAPSGLDRPLFVNFTRSFLVHGLPVPLPPERVVVEVNLEGPGDLADTWLAVAALRERGFRTALDRFVGSADQRSLLAVSDYVKIDARDLPFEGRHLVDRARSAGSRVVGTCIETAESFRACRLFGVDLFQGNLLRPTTVLDHAAAGLSPRRR